MRAARGPTLGLMLAATALTATARAQEVPPSLNPLAGLDKASLRGFVEAPLFEPSRRVPTVAPPVVFAPPPPPVIVEQPPSMHLLGVVEGKRSLAAVVHRDDTGKTETLHSGDRLGGWSVAVLPTGVRIREGGRVFDYTLFHGQQSGPVVVDTPPDAASVAERDRVR